MPLLKDGQIVADQWVHVEDDAGIAEELAVVVSLERWLDQAETLGRRNAPVAVALRNDQSPSQIVDALEAIDAVFLTFPAYTDGRAYSQARLLRQRYGFRGEIRATGNVLHDQYPLMLRCGFDAFEVADGADIDGWKNAVTVISDNYQTAGDGVQAIWAKRQSTAA